MSGLRGSRSVTQFVHSHVDELRFLPAHGVTWQWDDVVGDGSRCSFKAALRMLRAGYIVDHDDGFETSKDLHEFLENEKGLKLEAWRASLRVDEGQQLSVCDSETD